ncbi:MAG: DUF6377 domain-containing protein [Rikenellaceae bacterium]|nr:DUF6377 domain-containing protein [Rikenellaceae bacterium]
MYRRLLLAAALLNMSPAAGAAVKPDSLLAELDRAIAGREIYAGQKAARIEELKRRRERLRSPEEVYRINSEIIDNYESFVCDSAERYIHHNLAIAGQLNSPDHIVDSRLRLAFVYSLSGLFVQANDIFRTIDYNRLSEQHRIRYCWDLIRYWENLVKYTDNPASAIDCEKQIEKCRDELLTLLPDGSDNWLKEKAFALQAQGDHDGALAILDQILQKERPDTHGYAMVAASIAKVYRTTGDREQENRFLKMAAITDIRFAVKENEALLTLALNLFEQGDVDRSYNYISVALSDANFYNSRFRNTVIARIQPVIESNYLHRIDRQRQNLRLMVILLSLLTVALIATVAIIFRQMRIVAKARRSLREMNRQLMSVNRRLSEANIVKEKYIGHFMNRCAIYINKLDAYRRDINAKIKSGQLDRLYRPSAREHEQEVEELLASFDEAFLKLYPDFVDEFNSLLAPDENMSSASGSLNTELRIFALMRLGVVNVNRIAEFLHCSPQTIYNYKSNIKKRARKEISNFEEEVRKLSLPVSQLNQE